MRHVAYPKIPTARQLGSGRSAGGPWIATEKVHGAQLVIVSDGHVTKVGKRKAWLDGDEPFFGWQLLRPAFEQAARSALAEGAATVRVYGELYGGHYPHPDVPPAPGAAAVQTGVWYSPDVRFAVFDVLDHERPDDAGVYRTYAGAARVAAEAGLDVVPLLGRGTRASVDAVPTRFQSRLPLVHHLPPLEGNLAEGVVLRPDAALGPQERTVVKVKIAEFDEQRFGESLPWDPHARIPGADLARVAAGLVNAPRVASARSKVGAGPAPRAAGRESEVGAGPLVDEIVLDVLVDLSEAYPAAVAALDADGQAAIEDTVREAAIVAVCRST
ncbi:RNA ligase family protein [Dactylosporangium sp. NPDC006015]|uniref:RNA ligase family protein n=1 Tax=Dactylosporangium sp. NPDC006015 TaxID=3154576 RepID=UPI00339F0527